MPVLYMTGYAGSPMRPRTPAPGANAAAQALPPRCPAACGWRNCSAQGAASGLEAVAHAPDGGDPPGMLGVLLHLVADPADVLGDRRLVLPFRAGRPDVLEQLAPAEDLAGRAHQEGQEVELLGREFDRVPSTRTSRVRSSRCSPSAGTSLGLSAGPDAGARPTRRRTDSTLATSSTGENGLGR